MFRAPEGALGQVRLSHVPNEPPAHQRRKEMQQTDQEDCYRSGCALSVGHPRPANAVRRKITEVRPGAKIPSKEIAATTAVTTATTLTRLTTTYETVADAATMRLAGNAKRTIRIASATPDSSIAPNSSATNHHPSPGRAGGPGLSRKMTKSRTFSSKSCIAAANTGPSKKNVKNTLDGASLLCPAGILPPASAQ